jgi:hypothetical protein
MPSWRFSWQQRFLDMYQRLAVIILNIGLGQAAGIGQLLNADATRFGARTCGNPKSLASLQTHV